MVRPIGSNGQGRLLKWTPAGCYSVTSLRATIAKKLIKNVYRADKHIMIKKQSWLRVHMLHAPICVLLAASAVPVLGADMTIVMEFEDRHSERLVEEMKRETQVIVKDSGLHLDWQTRSEAGQKSFSDLVVVRFKGKCLLQPAPYLYDERGPLAFTYSTNGEIQPFSEVSCDKVTAALRPALQGGEFANADMVLGRALGRVVAHELMHMLTRSGAHGREGVGKASLSGKELITSELPLDFADLERISGPSANPPAKH
jgi:hypothetical protein